MKKAINRLINSITDKTELPISELCREFSLSGAGRREVTVYGVISIEEYTEDSIRLRVCGGSIGIRGKGLGLKGFCNGALAVRGRIDGIDYGGEC